MRRTFVLNLWGLIRAFAIGQASTQVLQAVNGLLLVWLLAIDQFAALAVFNAVIGFTSQLLGLAITPTIFSLIGPDTHKRDKLGRYLLAAWILRRRILMFVNPLGIAILCFSANKLDLSSLHTLMLALLLLSANYVSAQLDLHTIPLQMHRELSRIYICNIAGEIFRLLTIILCHYLGSLTVLTAVGISMGAQIIRVYALKRLSKAYVETPIVQPFDECRGIFHVTLPTLPIFVFGALQGQITIFASAVYGGTRQIASVGVLGRLSSLITFLSTANRMILGPALARMSEGIFWKRLPFMILFSFAVSAMVASMGFLFPEQLILVLGDKYNYLANVLWLATLNVGLSYFQSVMGSTRAFRRWIAWWVSFSTIGLIMLAQAFVFLLADLTTVEGVLLLGTAATSARIMVTFLVMAVARFRPHWLRSGNLAKNTEAI